MAIRVNHRLLVPLLLLASTALHAIDGEFTLGVGDQGAIARMENVSLIRGQKDKPELVLGDSEYGLDEDTDLLLSFNRASDYETGGNYELGSPTWEVQDRIRRLGEGAALFSGEARGTLLRPRNGALFYPGTFTGSFTIEFWQYSSSYGEGQNILSWEGSTWLGERQVAQAFSAGIRNGHMTWSFKNVFLNAPSTWLNFQLANRRELLPGTWNHHMLRHDARRGLVEYLLNGTTEDVRYVTASGNEGGQTFQAYIGERSRQELRIGASFRGWIDEVRISSKWVDAPQLNARTGSGYVIFKPIEFKRIGAGAKVINIQSTWRAPGSSDLRYFYFMLDSAFPPASLERNDKRWIPFEPGKTLQGKTNGLWLLVKVELLPDGTGESRPGFQDLRVVYTPDPPPPAPGGLTVTPGPGRVTLTWKAVPVNDIQGYVLYYGTRPGQYFGARSPLVLPLVDTHEGSAGVNLDKARLLDDNLTMSYVLEGLEDYQIYYFAIASFDRSNDPRLGMELKRSISREVSARPAP